MIKPLYYKKDKPVPIPLILAPLADTHTHIGSLKEVGVGEALKRAGSIGVELMVVPIDPVLDVVSGHDFNERYSAWDTEIKALKEEVSSDEYRNIERLWNNTQFLVGVHPYGAGEVTENTIYTFEELLKHPLFKGVGEIGLDYNSQIPKDVQLEVFRNQLAIAREKDVPVELHLRNAKDDPRFSCHTDALDVLKKDGMIRRATILHCYTANEAVMRDFTDLGCYIAYGGAASFASAHEIRKALIQTPRHLMLSETDAPYMAPVPLRGRTCEPAMIVYVVENLAQVRFEAGVDTKEQTYQALWNNARSIFT